MDGLKRCPDCGAYHSWRTSERCFNCHVASQTGPKKFPDILPFPDLGELKELGFELVNDVDEEIRKIRKAIDREYLDPNVNTVYKSMPTDWDDELRELWAKR